MVAVVYKTTDTETGNIYVGVDTKNNPDYFGSSSVIKKILKDNKNNHSLVKEILFEFDTAEEAFIKEAEIVTQEFVNRDDVLNIALGGSGGNTRNYRKGYVICKDKDNNTFQVHQSDIRLLSGELEAISKNMVTVKDKDNNTLQVSTTDERYINNELNHIQTGMVVVKDKNGKTSYIKKEELLDGDYVGVNTNKNYVYNLKTNERRMVDKSELKHLLQNGWVKGTSAKTSLGTKWVNNNIVSKQIHKDKLNEFLINNPDFTMGRLKKV